jgi:hypothetical protein
MIIDAPFFRRGGALALAVLLAACSSGEGDTAGGKPGRGKRPPQLVSAQVAAMEDFAPTLLALGTVTLAFGFIAILMFRDVPVDQQQMVIFALGFITSSAGQVLSFYFGSSQGSKDKTKEIEGLMKK